MMTDRERQQEASEEEASGSELGSLSQEPEGGDLTPTSENDPPIISSGG